MSEDHENFRGVVIHTNAGAAAASLEQERAEALDLLKDTNNFSLTALDARKDQVGHISFISDEDEFIPFLSYAAIQDIRALANAMEVTIDHALFFLKMLLDQDVGIG